MFVFSVHMSKKKILIFSTAFIMIAVFAFSNLNSKRMDNFAICSSQKYSLDASDNTKRVELLNSFEWQVESEPIEICEIIIPTVFNETYEKYNDLQKTQGLNLKKYMGKTCKKYVYQVNNYPEDTQNVRANLLVLDDKLIGADISSTKINGFMHGLKKP